MRSDRYHTCDMPCDDKDECMCRVMNFSRWSDPEGVKFYIPPYDDESKYNPNPPRKRAYYRRTPVDK